MIEVENIEKSFNTNVVLAGVSFTANAGEVTALIGPNGSGKTTLMKILLGLLEADSGKATFDGKYYKELGDHPFSYVGTFLDGIQPNPTRTGYGHLRWVAMASGIDKKRCLDCLRIVGLESAAHKKIKDYSLGMKQRLGLATAILGEPKILILDEPINGLDPEGIRWVREFLKEFVKSGRIAFITSHYMNELELTADKIIGLSHGKVIINENGKTILEKYGSFEAAYFECV